MDPIGIVPVFLGLTRSLSASETKNIVRSSILTAFVVALCFLFAGKNIFHFLGIKLDDFKIAGGLILLLVSLSDLFQKTEGLKESSGNTGIVPLAVPLITGPGLITTIILQEPIAGATTTFVALALNFVITFITLANAPRIAKLIGKDGTVVISKILAILLAAIAVGMIRSGLQNVLATSA